MALTPHIAIVMPARQEQDSLSVLLGEFAVCEVSGITLVLAVDEATDASVDVAAAMWSGQALHIAIGEQPGFGPSLRAGIAAALELRPDAVVTMCADGSDDPAAIPKLVAPVLAGEADMVIADRYLAGSWHLRPASRVVNSVLAHVTAGTVRDWSTLYRAWRPAWLRNIPLPKDTATWGVELTRRALLADGRVEAVPVRFRPRVAGKPRIPASSWWIGFSRYMMRQSPGEWLRIWRKFHA